MGYVGAWELHLVADDDVGRAELEGDLLAGHVAAHRDDPLGAEVPGGDRREQADRPVTHTGLLDMM